MRPGIQALMQDAQGKKFDLVLTESLDRISAIRKTSPGSISACVLPGCKS
jgi:hypothetical protein